jgi:uncharacterized protein YodC (DUF2158 family)
VHIDPPEFPVFLRTLADAVGADAVTMLPPPYRPHAALRVGGTLQVLVRQHVESNFTASLVRGPGFPVNSAEQAITAVAGLREALPQVRPAPLSICDALVALLSLDAYAHPELAFPNSLSPASVRLLFGGHPIVVFQRAEGVRIAVEEVEGRPSRVACTAAELMEVAVWAVETQRPILDAEQAARTVARPPLPPLEDVVAALLDGARLSFGGNRMSATFYAHEGVVRCDLFDDGYTEDAPYRPDDLERWMKTEPDMVWRAVRRT